MPVHINLQHIRYLSEPVMLRALCSYDDASVEGTDAFHSLVDTLATTHGLDIDKLRSHPGFIAADVNATAMEMIKATSRGDAELYYPPLFGISTRLFVFVRSLYPSLLLVADNPLLKD